MCKCRITKIDNRSKYLPYIVGKHYLIKGDFICPMCLHIKQRFSWHTNKYSDALYLNKYLECDYCHNYIREILNGKANREFFFVLDYCVMMTRDQVILEKEDCEDISLPFFIFQSEANLIKKIQTYTLLS